MKRARSDESDKMVFDYAFTKYFITTFFLADLNFEQIYSEHVCHLKRLQCQTCDTCHFLVESTCRCYLCFSKGPGANPGLYCRSCIKFCKTCQFHVCNKHYTNLHKRCKGNKEYERAKKDRWLLKKVDFLRTFVSFIIVKNTIINKREEEVKKTRACNNCNLLKH